jgi:hypothetical protein
MLAAGDALPFTCRQCLATFTVPIERVRTAKALDCGACGRTYALTPAQIQTLMEAASKGPLHNPRG